jgi:hypothetical protein
MTIEMIIKKNLEIMNNLLKKIIHSDNSVLHSISTISLGKKNNPSSKLWEMITYSFQNFEKEDDHKKIHDIEEDEEIIDPIEDEKDRDFPSKKEQDDTIPLIDPEEEKVIEEDDPLPDQSNPDIEDPYRIDF